MEKITEFEIEDSEKLKVWGLSPISPVTIAAVCCFLATSVDNYYIILCTSDSSVWSSTWIFERLHRDSQLACRNTLISRNTQSRGNMLRHTSAISSACSSLHFTSCVFSLEEGRFVMRDSQIITSGPRYLTKRGQILMRSFLQVGKSFIYTPSPYFH